MRFIVHTGTLNPLRQHLTYRVRHLRKHQALVGRHEQHVHVSVVIPHNLHQITAAVAVLPHDRGLKFRVGEREFVTGLVEREEHGSEATPPVEHRVGADRVKEPDARHLLVRVNLHHAGHETVRHVPVSGGVHLPLQVRVRHVPVHNLGALLRERAGRVTDTGSRSTVEGRQRGHHLSQITRRHIDHVRDDAAIKRALGEQVGVHVTHAALPHGEQVLHAAVTVSEP